MKVLHVGDLAFTGTNLCRELRRRGVDADLVSKGQFHSDETLKEGWVHYARNAFDKFRICGLDLNSYDLIHAHYLLNWSALGLRVRRPKSKVILHCHGGDARAATMLDKIIRRYVLGLGDTVLYSTPDLYADMKWFKGKLIYLPNPVDIPERIPNVETYKDRVLIYATMYKIKQIERLFPVIEKLPLEVDMIDSGEDKEYYKKIAPRKVRFLKPFKRHDVFEHLLKYPLVIGGSQDGTVRVSELEAMALGIPTLFPFKYNDFYPEPLPMPDFTVESIMKHFGDIQLGARQKAWTARSHGAGKVVDQLMEIYEK